MKKLLFATNNDWIGLILRLTLGIIIWPHGAQKLLGMFGGGGFEGTMGFFTGMLHLPWIVGFLVIIIEFFGSLMIIAGFATRAWAIAMIGLFIGIIFTAHIPNGFFMNWMGAQAGEGYEYHLLVIGIALALLVGGSGKFSVDGLIDKPASSN